MTMTRTYTLAAVEVSQDTFDEVTKVLKDAGTEYPFDSLHPERINMNGLCLVVAAPAETPSGVVCTHCNDTHTMEAWDESGAMWPCTGCPRPCRKCANSEGRGAYCKKTPCGCRCHDVR